MTGSGIRERGPGFVGEIERMIEVSEVGVKQWSGQRCDFRLPERFCGLVLNLQGLILGNHRGSMRHILGSWSLLYVLEGFGEGRQGVLP